MNKLLESAGIALDAIWGSKLRSLMTVLGNIVAVTSIIAGVSMIQGLNASVTNAILNQAGADSFSIQQFPMTRTDEEFEKVRANPRITTGHHRPRNNRPGDASLISRKERMRHAMKLAEVELFPKNGVVKTNRTLEVSRRDLEPINRIVHWLLLSYCTDVR